MATQNWYGEKYFSRLMRKSFLTTITKELLKSRNISYNYYKKSLAELLEIMFLSITSLSWFTKNIRPLYKNCSLYSVELFKHIGKIRLILSWTVARTWYIEQVSGCWEGRPFRHNRHGPKVWGCCTPFGGSSSSSSSSQGFLKWPKQQRHHEDHCSQSEYEQYQSVL